MNKIWSKKMFIGAMIIPLVATISCGTTASTVDQNQIAQDQLEQITAIKSQLEKLTAYANQPIKATPTAQLTDLQKIQEQWFIDGTIPANIDSNITLTYQTPAVALNGKANLDITIKLGEQSVTAQIPLTVGDGTFQWAKMTKHDWQALFGWDEAKTIKLPATPTTFTLDAKDGQHYQFTLKTKSDEIGEFAFLINSGKLNLNDMIHFLAKKMGGLNYDEPENELVKTIIDQASGVKSFAVNRDVPLKTAHDIQQLVAEDESKVVINNLTPADFAAGIMNLDGPSTTILPSDLHVDKIAEIIIKKLNQTTYPQAAKELFMNQLENNINFGLDDEKGILTIEITLFGSKKIVIPCRKLNDFEKEIRMQAGYKNQKDMVLETEEFKDNYVYAINKAKFNSLTSSNLPFNLYVEIGNDDKSGDQRLKVTLTGDPAPTGAQNFVQATKQYQQITFNTSEFGDHDFVVITIDSKGKVLSVKTINENNLKNNTEFVKL